MTDPIARADRAIARARAVAERHDLPFHIVLGEVCLHEYNWRSEDRPATDKEVRLWELLDRLTEGDTDT
jgi:hypothetical protein